MKHTPLTILTVISLALVGCGSTQAEEPAPETTETIEQTQPEQTPQADSMNQDPTADSEYTLDQEYFFYGKTPGVVGKFELPSEPVNEIEELREQVDAPEVTYITATIDNRQGAEGQRVQAISLFDEAGQQYEFTMAANHIDEWRGMLPQEPEHGNPENVGDYNTYIEVGNQYRHGADAGEVKQIVLLHEGTDLPEDITRVAVYTSGLGSEPVAALPTDHPEASHVDLDFQAPTN